MRLTAPPTRRFLALRCQRCGIRFPLEFGERWAELEHCDPCGVCGHDARDLVVVVAPEPASHSPRGAA